MTLTALGLSMGSTLAIWATALDPTIDACIDLCCPAEYDALIESGGFDQHGEYFFVPGLRAEFTAAEISALIAPRRHLSLVGRDDPLTPLAGVPSINTVLKATYASLGSLITGNNKCFPALIRKPQLCAAQCCGSLFAKQCVELLGKSSTATVMLGSKFALSAR